jgi:hypothetical protein
MVIDSSWRAALVSVVVSTGEGQESRGIAPGSLLSGLCISDFSAWLQLRCGLCCPVQHRIGFQLTCVTTNIGFEVGQWYIHMRIAVRGARLSVGVSVIWFSVVSMSNMYMCLLSCCGVSATGALNVQGPQCCRSR